VNNSDSTTYAYTHNYIDIETINSNDDSINEIIVTALKDLDNTFFVECLDSEDDEESNSLADIEAITDSDDDIPRSKLNEFIFVDVPNNYIEDKIYDDLKLEVQNFFEKGTCSCHSKQSCFKQIGYEKFLARQVAFESLDKSMRDMAIKGQLLAFQKSDDTRKVTNTNRKNLFFGYCYNRDISVCCNTYLALVGIGHKYLENIKRHLQEY
ncbi:20457_t:CDS:2, partial [Cetraspora pellucida]